MNATQYDLQTCPVCKQKRVVENNRFVLHHPGNHAYGPSICPGSCRPFLDEEKECKKIIKSMRVPAKKGKSK